MKRIRPILPIIILDIVMLLASLIILLPLAVMILSSFKTTYEANQLTLALPTTWHPENYIIAIIEGRLGRAVVNSLIITVTAVFLTVITASMCSFYLCRKVTPVTKKIVAIYNLGLVAPFSIIPTIWLLQGIGLSGTYASVILLHASLNIPFAVFLFFGFIKTVPRELDEAAIIDGSSSFRLFFGIVFPLLKPVTVTCTITSFMGIWNDFTLPLYLLNKSSMWPITLTVYGFFGRYARSWNLVFADIVICCIPVLIVYVFGQKFIIRGLTAGAVKG
jgi:raffinose/stachyose/melibiose transport system permease protein